MKRYQKGIACFSIVVLSGIFALYAAGKKKLILNEKMDIQNSDMNTVTQTESGDSLPEVSVEPQNTAQTKETISERREYLHEDLTEYGKHRVETPYFQIDLDEPFVYRKGAGILYHETPGVVLFSLLQMENLSDTELCFYLDRGYCIEELSPIELPEGKEKEAEVLYGVFNQSYYALCDHAEIFGLTGEEEDSDELFKRMEEEFHVILFYQPDSHIQYRLMANRRLVSYEEILDLAGKISFYEKAFTPEAWQEYYSNYSLTESDGSEETERLQQILAEQKKDALTFGKAFLKVTSFHQEQNLVPEGLFAVKESDKSYFLCLNNNGWPIGKLTVTDDGAEIEYFDLPYQEVDV